MRAAGATLLAIEPMQEESESTYRELFENLKERGLKDVWLGGFRRPQRACKKPFRHLSSVAAGTVATVHFVRSILAHLPAKGKAVFAEKA